MFFFYIIIILIFLIFILIRFTTIKIHIQNIRFLSKKTNGRYFNKNYKIEIKLYLFKWINYFKIDITKKRLERKEIRKEMKKLEKRLIANRKNFDLKSLNKLKLLELKIEKLKLDVNICLEDAATCAICTGIISSILAILLRKFAKEDNKWEVLPIYEEENFISINLDCTITVKLINIIKQIDLKKW